MEPAKIDWKTVDSEFVRDDVYEHINAPQWIDFLAPQDSVDDEGWFCRPDCKHQKTAEDFLKSTPSSKLLRSESVSKLIGLGDWSRRVCDLKRRGLAQSSTASSTNEDSGNQNPNLSTPTRQIKSLKEAIKSSAEKGEQGDECSEILLQNDEKPRLKSTLSARDLLGGRDILNKIIEFCNELKRMATRTKQEDNGVVVLNAKKISLESKKEAYLGICNSNSEKLNEKEKERRPLLEVVNKDKYGTGNRSNAKERQRRKKRDDEAENTPPPLDLKNVKGEDERSILPIRTSPPTPQWFSAVSQPAKTTPSKGPIPNSWLMEKDVLQEMKQNKGSRKELEEKSNGRNASVITGGEGKTPDVFWFLKPCVLSSSN
ncbi:hypothetical protein Nepgr_006260 [Nepenthes gracilis]|uniref:Uncharacterized protein n=1 Tax=Nepenthes gracilis TaxID=150966 RepID=A0AAD3S4V8_NEPGR|nr:hypothetical protein Nepgr_006260 [Nepenthes gracilis]